MNGGRTARQDGHWLRAMPWLALILTMLLALAVTLCSNPRPANHTDGIPFPLALTDPVSEAASAPSPRR